MRFRAFACLAAGMGLFAAACSAWNAHGHRTVTVLAIDALPTSMPAWLKDPGVRERIAHQACEPDRWRGCPSVHLSHENAPDHYIDVDQLDEFGLTLDTVPPLRNEYLRALIIAKHEHPESVSPYDVSKDKDRTKEWPGFAPHAIMEHYAKLRSSFQTLRMMEALEEPSRALQIEQEKANVIYHMGVLSHFVGDVAQPLHTTKHHHGWVGENPNGYTTDYRFHAYIDGDVLTLHGIGEASLASIMKRSRSVNAEDPWTDALRHIERSFEQVAPLYELERTGALKGEPGRKFIEARLIDGADMLAAMYEAAWTASEPTDQQILNFVKFDEFRAPGR